MWVSYVRPALSILSHARRCCSPVYALQSKDELSYHLTTHLRMNAVYWGLTALCVMGHKDALDRKELIDFVMSCWDDDAGLTSVHFHWQSRIDIPSQVHLDPTQITMRIYTLLSVPYRFSSYMMH